MACSIPTWVDLRSLDASDLHGYAGEIPSDAAGALIAVAHEHRRALEPTDPEIAHKTLRGLRFATIITNEDVAEAEATLKMLRVHLADVPQDILAEACRAYCHVPGRRFFPKSAGELRTFTNPLMRARVGRAFRLERLARRAHEEQAERDRLAGDPLTPEMMAEITKEFGISSTESGPSAAFASKPTPEATIQDYLDLGLSEIEARAAMEQRRRLLHRGRAKTIGESVETAMSDAVQTLSKEQAA